MKKILRNIISGGVILCMLPCLLRYAAPFADVEQSAWYATAVSYVQDSGKMVGVREGAFAPNEPVTRGMLATVLYRLDGGKLSYDTSSFLDNAKGQWYFEGIEYCAQNGIVYGYGDGRFGVADFVTREDMMTMIYRYANHHGLTEEGKALLSTYKDGNTVRSYATAAVNWCLAKGIVSGTSFTTISPAATASRAQLAQILMNFAEGVRGEDLRAYRKSEANPYGIGVRRTRLYQNELSFTLEGLQDIAATELVVCYYNGDVFCGEEKRTLSQTDRSVSFAGEASALYFISAAHAGQYRKGSAKVQLLQEGTPVFDTTISLGALLQKAPDGASLYFKGEADLDCRILLYHHFVDFEPIPESYGTVSTPKRFEEHLQYILDKGYSIIPMYYLIEYERGERALPQKSVVLNFDDGYTSNYTLIFPVLKKYNVHATIFAVTATMGEGQKMSWAQMREMEQSGLVDIQNHSLWHKDHTALSEKELHHYFATSFTTLEKELGKETYRILSYPMGRFTERSIAIAKQYGVQMQVTTQWKALDMNRLRLDRLPRINVSHDADMGKLLAVRQ